MAATKGNGFHSRVQPAHLSFGSIPRFIPLRVAHPPPVVLSNWNPLVHRIGSRVEKVCLDAPISFRPRGHFAAERTSSHGKGTSV